MYVYEASDGWKEHSVFSEHDGKDVEVFFEDEQHTFYAGTYTFERIRERNPQGCLQQTAEVRRVLQCTSTYTTTNALTVPERKGAVSCHPQPFCFPSWREVKATHPGTAAVGRKPLHPRDLTGGMHDLAMCRLRSGDTRQAVGKIQAVQGSQTKSEHRG